MDLHVIHNDAELAGYTELLFELTAKPGVSEAEARRIELLDLLISTYEGERYPLPEASPVEVLRFLMERNGLKQADLVPQLGSVSLISQILGGTRNLTVSHIRALSQRFGVPADVFIERSRQVA